MIKELEWMRMNIILNWKVGLNGLYYIVFINSIDRTLDIIIIIIIIIIIFIN